LSRGQFAVFPYRRRKIKSTRIDLAIPEKRFCVEIVGATLPWHANTVMSSGRIGLMTAIFWEFWDNFRHNLFKPLLLFFSMGFLVPILRVEFEFPHVLYQGLTIFLLVAIGWHGGEELAKLNSADYVRGAQVHERGICR
jgi:Na+-dependent bicarbonate transporter superfamily